MRKIYYLQWTEHGACYTRCFESEEERKRFSEMVSYRSISMWETEAEEL